MQATKFTFLRIPHFWMNAEGLPLYRNNFDVIRQWLFQGELLWRETIMRNAFSKTVRPRPHEDDCKRKR